MQLELCKENEFPLLFVTMVGGSCKKKKKFWFKGIPNDVPFYLLEEIEFFIYDYISRVIFNNTRFLCFNAEC